MSRFFVESHQKHHSLLNESGPFMVTVSPHHAQGQVSRLLPYIWILIRWQNEYRYTVRKFQGIMKKKETVTMTMKSGADEETGDGSQTSAASKKRTLRPSDWQHMQTLMVRTLKRDLKRPLLWLAKFLLAPVLFMVYTIGFFLGQSYDTYEDVVNAGGYQLYPGENWTLPSNLSLAGYDASYAELVGQTISLLFPAANILVNAMSTTNLTEFTDDCQDNIGSTADEGLCIFFDANDSYSIYFGGEEYATPYQAAIAGTQYVTNFAILNISNASALDPILLIQQTPRLLAAATVDVNASLFIVPPILQILAMCIGLQFMIGPVVNEKINHITDSFLMVGVKLRTYIFQWNLYYNINCLVTAGVYTLVSVYWIIIPLSDPFLIFMSHYFGLAQLNAFFILPMQTQTQEESAQGKPWIFGIFSMAVGSVLVIFFGPKSVGMYILGVFFPFIAIFQYYGIYTTYGYAGYDTGIHLGDNVVGSGLVGVYIAQLVGVALFLGATWLYSSPEFNDWISFEERDVSLDDGVHDVHKEEGNERFEPLRPGSDVVLSVRGLSHVYDAPRYSCDRDNKSAEVLKGLNLDLCRNEVFGYLGHNGAGKTTSVNVLTGQVKLQHGSVTYHFRDGDEDLARAAGASIIRTRIGVCPQHNTALLGDFTARENLRLIAYLKGGIEMEPGQSVADAVEAEVEKLLVEINFTSDGDTDRPVDAFSGGMKRKVLIAMALIGDPEVVFLDEPTAGLDPYNRRTIWDMIIASKPGRSIVLTTHFLDEADVLSDRIGIIKNGVMTTCGSSLFLKHHFGVGYTLSFDSPRDIEFNKMIPTAEPLPVEQPGSFQWRLCHGTEEQFPKALDLLRESGATNVNLQLTTLEQVFLETGKEDSDETEGTIEEDRDSNAPAALDSDTENGQTQPDDLARIWEPAQEKLKLGFWKKLKIVQHFMMLNAWKSKGTVMLNITMPLIYLIVGVVLATVIKTPEAGELVVNEPIRLSPSVATSQPMEFFGVPRYLGGVNPIAPLVPVDPPQSLADYFDGLPVLGGHIAENSTLQYAPNLSPFALQVGVLVMSNYTAQLDPNSAINGIATSVQQLPYLYTAAFRIDLLFIPYCLCFGFAGLAFSVLDILLLKGKKIIEIFRVNGVTEWTTYLGVMEYKFYTTFVPFFVLLIVLGFSLGIVLFGNAGRWLATILVCLSYAFSSSPQGLILAKRFIRSDYKSVANWFPGVYFTVVGLPYILYVSLLQVFPDQQQTIKIVGDVMSLVPQVAFQRSLGAIMEISSEYDEASLKWGDVWAFETRIWYCILMMLLVGILEWWYLIKLTTVREPITKLGIGDMDKLIPVDTSCDPLIEKERERSREDDQGINARDLVKVFEVREGKKNRNMLKRSVKGVSFGIRKNEIYALLGPNGAGKTVTLSMLASEITPENGDIALDGVVMSKEDRKSDALYEESTVSYCAQFDALFSTMTVEEHLKFYAEIRGLQWNVTATQDHINAIVRLLGLQKHRWKKADDLSGGYKRRLCLGISMIGYPHVMMLDECTTGLDPGARRLIWNVLKPEAGPVTGYDLPAILLSSHYMDECQQLGTRIGIMIDGAIVSTGSLLELFDRYCTSFFVELSFEAHSNDTQSEELILEAFQNVGMNASVYESLPFHIKLQVPLHNHERDQDGTEQLAQIFSLLESKRRALDIKFYSVAKMNLEQIFIDLSRKQFQADADFDQMRRTESTRWNNRTVWERDSKVREVP